VWLQLPDELNQVVALINQRLTEQANKRLAEHIGNFAFTDQGCLNQH
jgi:hypothetical protein